MHGAVGEVGPPAGEDAAEGACRRGFEGPLLPLLADDERRRLQRYVALFRSGDFDAIRAMLAEDVHLDLVNRQKLEGRSGCVALFYWLRAGAHWRFALGAVEGRPGMLVFDARGAGSRPAHFVAVRWRGAEIAEIRDTLFAPYFMEDPDWLRLD